MHFSPTFFISLGSTRGRVHYYYVDFSVYLSSKVAGKPTCFAEKNIVLMENRWFFWRTVFLLGRSAIPLPSFYATTHKHKTQIY